MVSANINFSDLFSLYQNLSLDFLNLIRNCVEHANDNDWCINCRCHPSHGHEPEECICNHTIEEIDQIINSIRKENQSLRITK